MLSYAVPQCSFVTLALEPIEGHNFEGPNLLLWDSVKCNLTPSGRRQGDAVRTTPARGAEEGPPALPGEDHRDRDERGAEKSREGVSVCIFFFQ